MALAVERRLRLVRLFIEDPGVHSRWHLQLRGGCGWCGYEDTRIHSRLHFGFRVARGDSRWHLQLRGGRGWCGFEDTRIHSRLHFGFRVARGDSRMMALAVERRIEYIRDVALSLVRIEDPSAPPDSDQSPIFIRGKVRSESIIKREIKRRRNKS